MNLQQLLSSVINWRYI